MSASEVVYLTNLNTGLYITLQPGTITQDTLNATIGDKLVLSHIITSSLIGASGYPLYYVKFSVTDGQFDVGNTIGYTPFLGSSTLLPYFPIMDSGVTNFGPASVTPAYQFVPDYTGNYIAYLDEIFSGSPNGTTLSYIAKVPVKVNNSTANVAGNLCRLAFTDNELTNTPLSGTLHITEPSITLSLKTPVVPPVIPQLPILPGGVITFQVNLAPAGGVDNSDPYDVIIDFQSFYDQALFSSIVIGPVGGFTPSPNQPLVLYSPHANSANSPNFDVTATLQTYLPNERVNFQPIVTCKWNSQNAVTYPNILYPSIGLDITPGRNGYDASVGVNNYFTQFQLPLVRLIPPEVHIVLLTPATATVGDIVTFAVVVTVPPGPYNMPFLVVDIDYPSGDLVFQNTSNAAFEPIDGLFPQPFNFTGTPGSFTDFGGLVKYEFTPDLVVGENTAPGSSPDGFTFAVILNFLAINTIPPDPIDISAIVKYTSSFPLPATSPPVLILPAPLAVALLTVQKTLLTTSTDCTSTPMYQIVVGHSTFSTGPAYDVHVSDIITLPFPSTGFTLIHQYVTGIAPTTYTIDSTGSLADALIIPILPLNSVVTFIFSLDIPPIEYGVIENVASVTYSQTLDGPVIDPPITSNIVTYVPTPPTLAITKTACQCNVTIGDIVVYEITATNIGCLPLNNVTLTDTNSYLLADIALATPPTTPNFWNVQGFGVFVSNPIPTLTAGESMTVYLAYPLGASVGAGPITNTLTATSTNGGTPTPVVVTTFVNAAAQLQVDKFIASSNPVPGGFVNYTILVKNVGNIATAAGVLVDTYPAGSIVSGGPWVPVPFPAVDQVEQPVGTIPPGGILPFFINLTIPNPYTAGNFVNTVAINIDDVAVDIASVSTPILGGSTASPAILIVKKSSAVLNLATDGTGYIDYIIQVTNVGNSPNMAATLTDVLPPNTNYDPAFSANWIVGTVPAPPPIVLTLDIAAGTLLPGTSTPYTLRLTIDANYPESSITNFTSITQNGNTNSDYSSITLPAIPIPSPAQLLTTKMITTNTLTTAGTGTITYNILVQNIGGMASPIGTLTDVIPQNTTITSPVNVWQPTAFVNVYNQSLSALAPGASKIYPIQLTLTNPAPGSILTNSAYSTIFNIDGPASSETITVPSSSATLPALLTVTKGLTSADLAVDGSGTITYALQVTNVGGVTSAATGNVLYDILPAGLPLVGGNNWSVPIGQSTMQIINPIAPGVSVTYPLTVKIPAGYAGSTVINQAYVAVNGVQGSISYNAINIPGSSTATPALLILDKAISAANLTTDGTGSITYTITVTNVGGTISSGAYINDLIPAGVTASGPGWVSGGPNILTQAIGMLAPGANIPFTLTFAIMKGYTGNSVTNKTYITLDTAVLATDYETIGLPGNCVPTPPCNNTSSPNFLPQFRCSK
jgi:uncharacterized repeat protein (TIGR01451 family)